MINKAILLGNVGGDPEFKDGQTPMTRFTIATEERWKDKSGNWQSQTEWHRIIAWGFLATIANEKLAKGLTVYVEGRIQTRKWQTSKGEDRYTTEIVAKVLKALVHKKEESQGPQEYNGPDNYGSNATGEDVPF